MRHPIVSAYDNWQGLIHSLSRERSDSSELSQGVNLIQEFREGIDPVYKILGKTDIQGGLEKQILCTTAHRSKGREWPLVVLGGDFQQSLTKAESTSGLDVELDLLCVAVTRARHRLDLSHRPFLIDLLKWA